MELRHLRYFVAVAEELNFRRAAERLRLAQPALSAQIKALEEELNVRLLERTTRSVTLTQAGRVFLKEARGVLGAASQAEQLARKAEHGAVGTLRVGVIAPAASPWLANVLRLYHQRFPGVQLSLSEITTAEQLLRLRAGELDAGLLRPPVHFPELEWRFVEQSPQVLAAPAGHRLARKRHLEWKDFDGEGLVMIQPGQQHGYCQGGRQDLPGAVCPGCADENVVDLGRVRRRPHHGRPGGGETPGISLPAPATRPSARADHPRLAPPGSVRGGEKLPGMRRRRQAPGTGSLHPSVNDGRRLCSRMSVQQGHGARRIGDFAPQNGQNQIVEAASFRRESSKLFASNVRSNRR
jgi:DNA-binding transcriptional LysR family regulator